ncbi:MAG TPA: mandelate racemase/muconate lactonizing enzyme family protein [Gammaproteobacteria bacterium]|nr:mandelate racemase/muconate lactonizing enzyme family protein [Gammaproteobacteria bacterium]
MQITAIDDLHADGGWRVWSFLRVTTDEGVVGWSEYNETQWNQGLTMVIRKLAESLVGRDPRAVGRIGAELYARTRLAPGGINQQAIAAIENACLDVKARALGIPVYALLGGPIRERLPVYWSHCGTFRARNHELFERVIGTPPLRTLDDVKALGREAVQRGFRAVKTNPILFGGDRPQMLNPGFAVNGLDPAHNYDARVARAITEQLAALRDGLGPETGLLLDVNFAFRPEGLIRLGRAIEPFGLTWLEADLDEPGALAHVRRSTATPIASLESLYGRRGYRPYFDQYAVDVAVVDVPWNGLLESFRIAAMAETYDVNVAPHNYYGHLSTLMSAHLGAAVPNFRILEIEADDVPWKDDLVTRPPVIDDGELVLPDGPGWGTQINEEAVREHPPRSIGSSHWFAPD